MDIHKSSGGAGDGQIGEVGHNQYPGLNLVQFSEDGKFVTLPSGHTIPIEQSAFKGMDHAQASTYLSHLMAELRKKDSEVYVPVNAEGMIDGTRFRHNLTGKTHKSDFAISDDDLKNLTNKERDKDDGKG